LNWIFLADLFFETFSEKFSSFFCVLSFLPGGFSSAWSLRFPILAPPDLEPDEAAESPTQLPTLQETFSS
jgi:hypothetical protein